MWCRFCEGSIAHLGTCCMAADLQDACICSSSYRAGLQSLSIRPRTADDEAAAPGADGRPGELPRVTAERDARS